MVSRPKESSPPIGRKMIPYQMPTFCPPFINLESVEPLQWEIRKFDEFCTNKEFYLMTCRKLLVSLQLLLKEWIDVFNENRIERIVDLPRR